METICTAIECQLEVLSVLRSHGLQHGTGEESDDSCEEDESCDNERRELTNQTSLEVSCEYRNHHDDSDDCQDGRDDTEEAKGLISAIESCDGTKYLETIRVGVQLGDRSFRTISVLDDDILYMHVLICSMNGHLSLDLESLGQNREGLDEVIAEGSVAGHDVLDIRSEEAVDRTTYQRITEVMEGSLILFEVGRRQTVANNHICIVLEYFSYEIRGCLCRISIITIGHDVTLCIDVTEHGTDNITLTLLTFVADDSSRLAGDLIGSITGIVVIDIDGRFRKNALEVFYNLFDGLALIVARNHNCNLIHDSPHFLKLS